MTTALLISGASMALSAAAGGSPSKFRTPVAAHSWGTAADCHLGDIYLVLPENRAHPADNARHVGVGKHQKDAVEKRFQAVIVDLHQPWHVAAEQGSRGAARFAFGRHLGADDRIERSPILPRLFDQFNAALRRKSTSALTMFTSSTMPASNSPHANAALNSFVSFPATSPR